MTAAERYLEHERAHLRPGIRREIETLQHKLAGALRELEADDSLDPHLVANSAMLTALIARWNLARELAPRVAADLAAAPARSDAGPAAPGGPPTDAPRGEVPPSAGSTTRAETRRRGDKKPPAGTRRKTPPATT